MRAVDFLGLKHTLILTHTHGHNCCVYILMAFCKIFVSIHFSQPLVMFFSFSFSVNVLIASFAKKLRKLFASYWVSIVFHLFL